MPGDNMQPYMVNSASRGWFNHGLNGAMARGGGAHLLVGEGMCEKCCGISRRDMIKTVAAGVGAAVVGSLAGCQQAGGTGGVATCLMRWSMRTI